MPSCSVDCSGCWTGGDLVFLGVIVSLAEFAAVGVAELFDGATDGVTIGEGLQAASRSMTVMDILSFFDPLVPDHV